MSVGASLFLIFLLLGAASVGVACALVATLAPEPLRLRRLRALLPWSFKGLLVPLLLWALLNAGLSWNLQPFMPQVQAARNSGGGWFAEYLHVLSAGLFVICSYWAALTLAWTVIEADAAAEGEGREQFRALCRTCFIGLVLPVLLLLYVGGWMVLGLAGIALLAPMAGYGARVLHPRPTRPMYSRAVARMKFGKYSEAEWEIIRELEKHEDDFDGWMMLAGLYADQFSDIPEAEQTILEICDHPRTTPPQLSVALHKLADWQLQRAADPAAARRALQMICDRLPGTHLARMAQLRMNQIPATVAELRQQQNAEPIPLPALGDSIDREPTQAASETERREAASAANDCVEMLKRDPNNAHAREKLARLLAERLDQPERGIEQANLLLELPDQADARRAEWMGLIAAWHIRLRRDPQAGHAVLERLIREFPQSPQALAARRRLQLLDAESSRLDGPGN